ncbi:MAG TPA: hypothetical protein H9755_14425 [Candidatus Dietzia intestinigallinarum]|nr:hypothetical protein [Candidatus Dietzia intestinigallinarum]
MSTYRFRTPDRTIDLGEFGSAQEALEAAVVLQNSDDEGSRPADGTLEVQVGRDWHPVDMEGDMS